MRKVTKVTEERQVGGPVRGGEWIEPLLKPLHGYLQELRGAERARKKEEYFPDCPETKEFWRLEA